MRWIFIGLLALNLAYLVAWQLQSGGKPVPADAESALAEPEFPASLQLLEEAGTVPPAPPVPVSPVPSLSGCPAVGPFPEAGARAVAESLAAAGFEAAARETDAPMASLHWVHIPPLDSKASALRQLKELQARSIDSFIVSEGEFANAISLGSFQNRDSAITVQARVRSAGYPAEVREIRRDLRQHWVVLADPLAQGFTGHVPGWGKEGLRSERLPCSPR